MWQAGVGLASLMWQWGAVFLPCVVEQLLVGLISLPRGLVLSLTTQVVARELVCWEDWSTSPISKMTVRRGECEHQDGKERGTSSAGSNLAW